MKVYKKLCLLWKKHMKVHFIQWVLERKKDKLLSSKRIILVTQKELVFIPQLYCCSFNDELMSVFILMNCHCVIENK